MLSLFDLCLQRAETVGYPDAELTSASADDVAFGEAAIDDGVGNAERPVEDVLGINRNRQAVVLEERALQGRMVVIPGVHTGIGINGLAAYLSLGTQRQVQLPGQLLPEVHIVFVRPTVVGVASTGVVVIRVDNGIVQFEGSRGKGFPLYILPYLETPVAQAVVVGLHTDFIVIDFHRRQAVVGKLIGRCQAECQPGCFQLIAECNSVCVGSNQIGIA